MPEKVNIFSYDELAFKIMGADNEIIYDFMPGASQVFAIGHVSIPERPIILECGKHKG